MVAFVSRHHGDKIPSCEEMAEELNKKLQEANPTSNLTDTSIVDGIVKLTTLDATGGSVKSTNSSEFHGLTNGLTDDSGKQKLIQSFKNI